ncbi:MAG: phosphoadenosine phosphosulfate reductase [Roseicyclus sp.]|uniref:phosphoadenosine phosphosulfate reductase n=1 Tax=Boseongicola sp. H5 TaxID=2763261 RepID=UPI001B197FD8|nr:phosphoadenosine phosphosulfate reductase [Boseongicola sp. H5]MBO6603248.1 phosphoadenosine phosphosulfate reductase [Roseicyclus sp.]MBO6623839.1 phosphoadenosine phosphosulfate reductase [Roseicyclus sp.]MBO6921145.1 phosphoadenosine phosphosulfate reductase [Roseicyclus sp.]
MSNPTRPSHDSRQSWLAHLTEIGRAHGFFERIGKRHSALFVEEGPTLLVTFDEAARVYGQTEDGLPIGFDAVQRHEWSLLNIMASGQSWFRDADLYAFFDKLVDEGFFDSFDRVVFLGAGPMCGYAACAYAVTSPGARVLALGPAATLDREDAPFEMRFRGARRLNFTDRYGYAPYMVDGTAQTTIVYDPYDPPSAAHAALFRAPNTTRLPMRWCGASLLPLLARNGALDRLLQEAARGRMTVHGFARITRTARRSDPAYLKRLMARALDKGRPALARKVAAHGAEVTGHPEFAAALQTLGAAPGSQPTLPA